MGSEEEDFKNLPSEEQLARAQEFRDGFPEDIEAEEARMVSKRYTSNLARFEPPVDKAEEERFAALMRAWGR